MTNNISTSFEDMLNACLDLLAQGTPLADCLNRYPQHAESLRPMLELASELQAVDAPRLNKTQASRIGKQALMRLEERRRPATHLRYLSVLSAAAALLIVVGAFLWATRNDPTTTQPAASIEALATAASPTIVMATETEERATSVAVAVSPTETDAVTDPPATTTVSSPALQTETVEAGTDPPPTPSPTNNEEESDIPIVVDFTGEIESFDAESRVLVINGTSVTLDNENIPSDLTLAEGNYVTVSGALQEDGTLQADMIQAATAEDATCSDEIDCLPAIMVLSEAFGADYEDLIALNEDGLGYSEISRAYLVAETAGLTVDEIIALREAGLGWGKIIRDYTDLSPSELRSGIVIGNGRGQTIRDNEGGPPVYPGNSGNAPRGSGNNNAGGRGGGQGNNGNQGGGNDKDK